MITGLRNVLHRLRKKRNEMIDTKFKKLLDKFDKNIEIEIKKSIDPINNKI